MQPEPGRRLPTADDYNPYVYPFGPPSSGAPIQPLASAVTSSPSDAPGGSPTTANSAVISMVMGLVAIPMLCVLMLGIIPAIAAVITGHVALGRIKRSGGALAGRGFAITGLATGYTTLALWALLFAALIPAIRDARNRAAVQNANPNANQILDEDVELEPGDVVNAQLAEQRLRDAELKIVGASNGVAHGNTPEARQLAAKFAESMKTLRETFFTKNDKNSISITNGQFITYCELHDDRCAFVVHVPAYRKFTSKAKEQLAALAWAAASASAGDKLQHDGKLGVALKGTILFGAIMVGEVGGELPDLDGGRDDLLAFFQNAPAPVELDSLPTQPAEVESPLPEAALPDEPLPEAAPEPAAQAIPEAPRTVTPQPIPRSIPRESIDERIARLRSESRRTPPRPPEYVPGRGVSPSHSSRLPHSAPGVSPERADGIPRPSNSRERMERTARLRQGMGHSSPAPSVPSPPLPTARRAPAPSGQPSEQPIGQPSGQLSGLPSGQPTAAEQQYGPDSQMLAAQFPSKRLRSASIAFSPDGRRLAVGQVGGSIAVFDIDRREELPPGPDARSDKMVTALAFSSDGRQLYSGGYTGSLAVWDVSDGGELSGRRELMSLPKTVGRATSLQVTRNGAALLIGSHLGRVHVMDLSASDRLMEMQVSRGNEFAIREIDDGRALVADKRGIDQVDLRTGTSQDKNKFNYISIQCGDFSPDGKFVAIANRNQIDVWDIDAQQQLATLDAGETQYAVSYAHGGELLISGGLGKFTVWNPRQGVRMADYSIGPLAIARVLAVSPNSELVAAIGRPENGAAGDPTGAVVYVYRLPEPTEATSP